MTARSSPDDRVIDQNKAFTFNDFFDSGQLDSYLIQPVIRTDERPADIFVFYKTDAIRDTGFPAVAECGVQT